MPSHCDGCGADFTIFHSLDCKNSGLITARHSKLCDGVADLAGKAFTPMHVRDDPKIFIGRDMRGGESKEKGKAVAKGKEAPPLKEVGDKGDLLTKDLWTHGTDSIHNMRVVNTDAISYQSKTPEKCLETTKRKRRGSTSTLV